MIPNSAIRRSTTDSLPIDGDNAPKMLQGADVFEEAPELQELWDQVIEKDAIYRQAFDCVAKLLRSFPLELKLKV